MILALNIAFILQWPRQALIICLGTMAFVWLLGAVSAGNERSIDLRDDSNAVDALVALIPIGVIGFAAYAVWRLANLEPLAIPRSESAWIMFFLGGWMFVFPKAAAVYMATCWIGVVYYLIRDWYAKS
jgi:hypothetical protein